MTDADASGAVLAEWSAVRTIASFFRRLDERDYAGAAALFGDDGCWIRLDERLSGAAAVEAALAKRPDKLATRHVVSNAVALAEAGDAEVCVRYYITVYDDQSGAVPAALGMPAALFDAKDRLRRVGDDWQFIERAPRLVFKRG